MVRIPLIVILVLVSLAIPFVALEVVLRTTDLLAELDTNRPVYRPLRYVRMDKAIAESHRARAETHPFGFNDIDRPANKEAGIFRIAMVGDSFVFGDGLRREEDRWNRKLEMILAETYPNVEVLHWGRNGWSTRDQLAFLREHATDYHLDAIVFGWVANDPDLGDIPPRLPRSSRFFEWIGLDFVLPEVSKWLSDHIHALINTYFGTGYAAWETQLYTEENLAVYRDVVSDVVAFLNRIDVPFVFVLLPNNNDGERFEPIYAQIIPLLESADAPTLDLLPAIQSELGSEPSRTLWANPANGHPGPLVTAIFAREVAKTISTLCVSVENRLLSCDLERLNMQKGRARQIPTPMTRKAASPS